MRKPFDLQTILDNILKVERAEEMKTSIQLTVGELILKLEVIRNQNLPIRFDIKKYCPTGLDSWRGSYQELAIQYEYGGGMCYEQLKPKCERDDFGDHHYKCKCGGSEEFNTTLPKNPKVSDFLKILKFILGKYFIGYKGGDFTMGKTTPLWVANNGESSGFRKYKDYKYYGDFYKII